MYILLETILTFLDGRFVSAHNYIKKSRLHNLKRYWYKRYCNDLSSVTWIMPRIAFAILPLFCYGWSFPKKKKGWLFSRELSTLGLLLNSKWAILHYGCLHRLPRKCITMLMCKFKTNTSGAKSCDMSFCMSGMCYQ